MPPSASVSPKPVATERDERPPSPKLLPRHDLPQILTEVQSPQLLHTTARLKTLQVHAHTRHFPTDASGKTTPIPFFAVADRFP